MKTTCQITVLLLSFLFLRCSIVPSGTPQKTDFKLIRKTLVGDDGFWDYLTVDTASRQLYLSHGSQVAVLNADTHKRLATIAGQGIHGVTLVPDIRKGFITNGSAGTVTVFDTRTFEKTGDIAVGKNPDAALYDPYSKRLFVFNADGDDATVIDPAAAKSVGSVALGGAPEAAATDGKGTIFVNLEDKSEVVAFDAQTLKILRRMPLAPGEEPTGLAMDVKNNVLFSVCQNRRMLALDAKNGKILAKLPIGEHADGVVFDAGRQLAISSNGEGTLTVVRELSPLAFKVVQTVPTEPGARTIALDAKTHHVFTATAQLDERPAPTADNPNPRRKTVPGTFSVLEYGE